MKPVQLIAGLGVLLILGFAAWFMYMQRMPPFEQATERSFNLKTAKPAAELMGVKGTTKPKAAKIPASAVKAPASAKAPASTKAPASAPKAPEAPKAP